MARVAWRELPPGVRERIAGRLGAPVVRASVVRGGFSPGFAGTVTCADGRELFVKATSAELNAHARELYRQESLAHRSMPRGVAGAPLLWTEEWDTWTALAFPVVAGRNPPTPWSERDVGAVVGALRALGDRDAPPALPEVGVYFAPAFESWRLLAASGGHDLHPWAERWLPGLVELEQRAVASLSGTRLLHADLRADNVLMPESGPAVLVDWAYACRGDPLFDVTYFLVSVAADDGRPPERLLRRLTAEHLADHDDVTALIAAFAGWFSWMAVQPSPPGLPTLRSFQSRMAETARAWTALRTGWS